MALNKWNGSAHVPLTVAKRWNGTAWVDLTIAKRWNGTSWVDMSLPGGGGTALSATVSPGSSDGAVSLSCPGCPLFAQVCGNSVTITATGGSGAGPTVSWARLSGSTGISVSDPTSFTVVPCASVGRDQEKSAVWRATVVRGAETVTVDVPFALTYTSDI